MLTPFENEKYIDFSIPENRERMLEEIAKVESQFGKTYDLIIGGKRITIGQTFASINPSNKDEVVGYFQKATEKEAEMAIEAALEAFEEWHWMPAKERANVLLRTAAIMRRERFNIDAWMILEVGKNWIEADADIAEAIDFCEFYAREMVRLSADQPLTPIKGEFPELKYIPLGVGAIIPPWNFPSAILTGMTTAAIVAGNTVVLKPASPAAGIAYRIAQILEEAGLPPGVLNYLSGPGSLAGEALVKHPKTRFISFTGSKEIGLRINENAAKLAPGQIWIKRVVAEMGGKDFIIVDSECDMKAALKGVLVSAFGYQGQKCSACSRLILLEDIYDKFLKEFIPMVEDIKIGPTKDPDNYLGPVINEAAYNKILEYIEIGKKEAELLTGGGPAEGNGFFIKPTVFGNVPPDARIAQEEIFGPVVAVIKAKTFEDAIKIANSTEYGLTGSVYSVNRKHIRMAKRYLFVGNLYINRKCTGALVGVHPFGGFNMSGTDSKAGGRDYLLLFTQAKSISEKYDY